MTYYKILVEPAKSSKGKCKICSSSIQKNDLRVQMVDRRKFEQYIQKNGGRSAFSCEGLHRGYFETQDGVISVEKYFVHLNCYTPLVEHDYSSQLFKLQKCKNEDRMIFNDWLEKRKEEIRGKDKAQEKKFNKQRKTKQIVKKKSKKTMK